MSNTKTPLLPLITQAAPDAPIDLGELALEWQPVKNESRQPLTVKAQQVFLPKPRFVLRGETKECVFGGQHAIYWPGIDKPLDDSDVQKNIKLGGPNSGTSIEWQPDEVVRDHRQANEPLAELNTHLFSFPDFFSPTDINVAVPQPENPSAYFTWKCGYFELQSGGWHLTISTHFNTRDWLRRCDEGADYALTHTVRIRRADGQSFQPADAEELRLALHHFLSFAAGRWILMGCEVGLDAQGERAWERMGMRNGSRWKKGGFSNWWNSRSGGGDLVVLWPGFWKLWNDSAWKAHVKEVLYWYLQASQQDVDVVSVDGGLIQAQVSLERLAWAYLVDDKKTWSKTQAKKHSTTERVVEVCAQLKIPITGGQMNHPGYDNAVDMVVKERNNATHVEKHQYGREDVSFDAWNHALWLIEMILLRLMEYEGKYMNRLHSDKCAGQTEAMPWSAVPAPSASPPSNP